MDDWPILGNPQLRAKHLETEKQHVALKRSWLLMIFLAVVDIEFLAGEEAQM